MPVSHSDDLLTVEVFVHLGACGRPRGWSTRRSGGPDVSAAPAPPPTSTDVSRRPRRTGHPSGGRSSTAPYSRDRLATGPPIGRPTPVSTPTITAWRDHDLPPMS
jgi:hypothetical protein